MRAGIQKRSWWVAVSGVAFVLACTRTGHDEATASVMTAAVVPSKALFEEVETLEILSFDFPFAQVQDVATNPNGAYPGRLQHQFAGRSGVIDVAFQGRSLGLHSRQLDFPRLHLTDIQSNAQNPLLDAIDRVHVIPAEDELPRSHRAVRREGAAYELVRSFGVRMPRIRYAEIGDPATCNDPNVIPPYQPGAVLFVEDIHDVADVGANLLPPTAAQPFSRRDAALGASVDADAFWRTALAMILIGDLDYDRYRHLVRDPNVFWWKTASGWSPVPYDFAFAGIIDPTLLNHIGFNKKDPRFHELSGIGRGDISFAMWYRLHELRRYQRSMTDGCSASRTCDDNLLHAIQTLSPNLRQAIDATSSSLPWLKPEDRSIISDFSSAFFDLLDQIRSRGNFGTAVIIRDVAVFDTSVASQAIGAAPRGTLIDVVDPNEQNGRIHVRAAIFREQGAAGATNIEGFVPTAYVFRP